MTKSKIEYTDRSWNPVTGCSKVSEGCRDCWAERLITTRLKHLPRYEGGFKPTVHQNRFNEPLHWKKPSRIFVCPMGDLFHESIDYDFIVSAFLVMFAANKHVYQVLTKRPERMDRAIKQILDRYNYVAPHIWLGVSAENQNRADERIPILLDIPAAVRWVSLEPLLGPVDLSLFNLRDESKGLFSHGYYKQNLHWVVIGCESGSRRRPCKIEWVRDIVQQCKATNIPVFVKQLDIGGKVVHDINQFPEDLRVRQYPEDKR